MRRVSLMTFFGMGRREKVGMVFGGWYLWCWALYEASMRSVCELGPKPGRYMPYEDNCLIYHDVWDGGTR